MRIIKTAQFDFHEDSPDLDDMKLDDQHVEVRPLGDKGLRIELEGHGHMGHNHELGHDHAEVGHDHSPMSGEATDDPFDSIPESLGDLVHNVQEAIHPDSDVNTSIEVEPQEDTGIDENIFGEGSHNDEEFNDLSLDGDLDGHVDLGNTNDTKPDEIKDDFSDIHDEDMGDPQDDEFGDFEDLSQFDDMDDDPFDIHDDHHDGGHGPLL